MYLPSVVSLSSFTDFLKRKSIVKRGEVAQWVRNSPPKVSFHRFKPQSWLEMEKLVVFCMCPKGLVHNLVFRLLRGYRL